ncbi:hypothetical protein C5B89_14070 [Haloferax sp. Atlit-47N]|nr:hypothetical protein DEQ67_11640 [Haloferax sp. Atlit-48N]RDZ38551.1 hypothetical protein C5B89_14070 [Haloferax sp. Atlit-47N]
MSVPPWASAATGAIAAPSPSDPTTRRAAITTTGSARRTSDDSLGRELSGLMVSERGPVPTGHSFRERRAKRPSGASIRPGGSRSCDGSRPPAVSVRLVGLETGVSGARYL